MGPGDLVCEKPVRFCESHGGVYHIRIFRWQTAALPISLLRLIKLTISIRALALLGICFWRDAPETAVGPDRRAGKRKGGSCSDAAQPAASAGAKVAQRCSSLILRAVAAGDSPAAPKRASTAAGWASFVQSAARFPAR